MIHPQMHRTVQYNPSHSPVKILGEFIQLTRAVNSPRFFRAAACSSSSPENVALSRLTWIL